MVKKLALAMLAALFFGGVAHADDAFNMLGFHFAVGSVPVEHDLVQTVSFGLGVEHPVFTRSRVFGEYEWLYLGAARTEMDMQDRHGSGHRAVVGLRRELIGKAASRLRLFIDGELGGGVALTNDSMSGMRFSPAAITGLRFGYDLYSSSSDSPSRTFEGDMLVRMIVMPDGIGFMAGLGMAWGN